jgi:hypothetical protein
MCRERALKVRLVLLGLLFPAGVNPLMVPPRLAVLLPPAGLRFRTVLARSFPPRSSLYLRRQCRRFRLKLMWLVPTNE